MVLSYYINTNQYSEIMITYEIYKVYFNADSNDEAGYANFMEIDNMNKVQPDQELQVNQRNFVAKLKKSNVDKKSHGVVRSKITFTFVLTKHLLISQKNVCW